MDVSYQGNVVEINDTSIEVRLPVKDAIVVDETAVVILEQPPDENDPRNVLGFDRNGNQLWEIQPVRHKSMSEDFAPYISINRSDGRVEARNWNSYRYTIDLETGEVSEIGFTR